MTVSLGSGQIAVLDMRMVSSDLDLFIFNDHFVFRVQFQFIHLSPTDSLLINSQQRQQRLRALLRRHDGACYGSVLVKDGNTCLSWSSDCTVK